MRKIIFILLVTALLIPVISYSQSISDYLILQDISPYKMEARKKVIGGYIGGPRVFDGAGVIASTDHFYVDHTDKTYEVYYEGGDNLNSPTVQVTQHAGVDSDKWLLHEIEDNYHDDETETLGLLTDGAVMRKIDNNRVLWLGIGGGTFRWVRNNVVINVSYTDLQGTKPEPIEVVKAYLSKFPSTITLTDAELKASAHNVQWIKDEMERRLWLCDKWSMQLQLGKVSQADMLSALVKNMTVFLNYRQKYFGVSADKDFTALSTYLTANDGTSIKAKLTEYKTWWSTNKTKSISL